MVPPVDSQSTGRAERRQGRGGSRSSVQRTGRRPDRFDAGKRAIQALEPAQSGRRNGTRTANPERRDRLRSACGPPGDRSIRAASRSSPPRSSRRTGRDQHSRHSWPCSPSSSNKPTPRRPPTASPGSPPGRMKDAGNRNDEPSWQRRDRNCLNYHKSYYTIRGDLDNLEYRPRTGPIKRTLR